MTVIARASERGHHPVMWRMRCVCGREVCRRVSPFKRGILVSCGCQANALIAKSKTTHGGRDTRLWRIWNGMKYRCNTPTCRQYRHYGGRGIGIYKPWNDDFSIFREAAIESGYKDDLTIERIEVNKGYQPGNIKWIPKGQQALNTTRTIILEFNGERKTLKAWSLHYGYAAHQVRRVAKRFNISFQSALERIAVERSPVG